MKTDWSSLRPDGTDYRESEFDRMKRQKAEILKRQAGKVESELDELRSSMDQILIGGNHLASALMGMLSVFPSYETDPEVARSAIFDVNKYDAWVCWRTIMLVRDKLSARKEGKL